MQTIPHATRNSFVNKGGPHTKIPKDKLETIIVVTFMIGLLLILAFTAPAATITVPSTTPCPCQ
jgi:hypothetical protein